MMMDQESLQFLLVGGTWITTRATDTIGATVRATIHATDTVDITIHATEAIAYVTGTVDTTIHAAAIFNSEQAFEQIAGNWSLFHWSLI